MKLTFVDERYTSRRQRLYNLLVPPTIDQNLPTFAKVFHPDCPNLIWETCCLRWHDASFPCLMLRITCINCIACPLCDGQTENNRCEKFLNTDAMGPLNGGSQGRGGQAFSTKINLEGETRPRYSPCDRLTVRHSHCEKAQRSTKTGRLAMTSQRLTSQRLRGQIK